MPGPEVFRWDGDGFAVALPDEGRSALTWVAEQMRETLTGDTSQDDPAVARLFPQAYHDDPMRTLEFEQIAGPDLEADRLRRFDVLERTAHARWLTEEQLLDWMRAINDARIVIAVRLEVTEETTFDDLADDSTSTTYLYLSYLLEAIVAALGDPLERR